MRDAKLAGRHGERAKRTGLRALLFEPPYADFKLQALVNLPVLEVAEFFVNVVDFGSEPVQRSFDCRKSYIDFRKFLVHVSSQVGEFFMHACEMRSQSRIYNVLDLFQLAFVHTGKYTMRAQAECVIKAASLVGHNLKFDICEERRSCDNWGLRINR